MRTVGVVTAARSDYGILAPVLRRIQADDALDLALLVCGAHLADHLGRTIDAIRADGLEPAETLETLVAGNGDEASARSLGRAVTAFADALARRRPDLVLVLGDRYEMFAAAAAALPLAIPVAHVHGGESSEGAIDEQLRHAITKLSHLHFAAAEPYARRLVQMGEEPWRVSVTGAPGLDAIRETPELSPEDLERAYGLSVGRPLLLLTYHPVTLAPERSALELRVLLDAVAASPYEVVATYPGADAGGEAIVAELEARAASDSRIHVVPSLGSAAYITLMRHAVAMVGNSSSGIVEAATVGLPVVNIGDRQRGRLRAPNVIDVAGDDAGEVAAAVDRATSAAFRDSIRGLQNPYGDGRASERIVTRLRETPIDRRLLMKRFHDLGDAP